ncbi:hypothetical protein ACOSP7_024864 [Xanthoceras sorbifolium]
MVFSSVPVYLDPPNWQQQPNHHLQHGSHGGNENHHHHHHQQLPPLPPAPHVGGGSGGGGGVSAGGSVRPGSMADRARLAKIPQPETALKCPRCDSANTKFCYFNNYSLSQPRHFCKTCRRYWTRGGALRNVPVGGGCRRNKKNKSTSKSPVSSTHEKLQMGSNNNSNATSSLPSEILPNLSQQNPQLPFMSSLQNLTQYNLGNLGLNFGGIQAQIGASSVGNGQADLGFQIGSNSSMSSTIFPNFFEPSTGVYSFHSDGINDPSSSLVGENQLRSMTSNARVSQQAAPVKMEDNHGLNLARPFLGVSENNNQYWSGNTWTDLSGLNSSSANHLL